MANASPPTLHRREFLTCLTGAAVLAGAAPSARAATPATGRLKQAACRSAFKGSTLDWDGMCREAARLGLAGFDLVGPNECPTLKKYGLIPTMFPGGSGIQKGICKKENHAGIDKMMREAIKAAAAAGAPNVIVLAGDRAGITDEQGLEDSATFLNPIKALAEDSNVTLCIELLNSKVDHPGYICDHTAWGVALCKAVNSPKVKLLYDIYHMQIMEGDIIRTIRDNIQYIGHFHTAGNPGRHEFDETQELCYPPICKAIADLGFQGYLAHEYTPTRDPLPTLEKMIKLCEA
ncbi:MAG: TIM barrel protein [Akkermansiaceae bacterium]|nr:TIM barrel protein [Akkermansiaceae bacterium]MCF7733937.1 TIM barrel protein [Akkermansiaceae bacterium]